MPLPRIGQNGRGVAANNVAGQARGAAAAGGVDEEDMPGPNDPQSDGENPNNNNNNEAREQELLPDEGTATQCCLPSGCTHIGDTIHLADPCDAVKLICNNDACTTGGWMHADCFQEWERQVLNYLRTCGRARSWSEKQRLQNLWTKKGYDLAFKACDCKCAKGHLRKDLSYIPPPPKNPDADRRQRKIRKSKVPQRRGSTGTTGIQPTAESARSQLRIRTSSLCSNGSSPPSSEGMSPQTSAVGKTPARSVGKFDFFADPEQAAAGNIFFRRMDLSAFRRLPVLHQNPYQIKVEDEGPHGNDETRSFILTNLSSLRVTVVACVVCHMALPVYDKYPLIDGTFFLSPYKYTVNSVLVPQASDHQPRRLYLNAICMQCLSGVNSALACVRCQTPWSGSNLVIGTMYAYDIFAASPCCAWRLTCKTCHQPVVEPRDACTFFSQYSRLVPCPHCGSEDFHFIRPLHDLFRLVDVHH